VFGDGIGSGCDQALLGVFKGAKPQGRLKRPLFRPAEYLSKTETLKETKKEKIRVYKSRRFARRTRSDLSVAFTTSVRVFDRE
jgi:hypothetical protein